MAASCILVGLCKKSLRRLCGTLEATVPWVPGKRNIERNESIGELARWGLAVVGAFGVTTGTVNGGIYSHYLIAADFRW